MRGPSSTWSVLGLAALVLVPLAGAMGPPPASLFDAVRFVSWTAHGGNVSLGAPTERVATMVLLLFMTSLVGLYMASRYLKRKGTGFSVEAMGGPPTKADRVPDLEPGEAYLVTQGQNRALKVFSQAVKEGDGGLAITRTHPEKLRGSWDLEGAKLHWLTDGGNSEKGAVQSLEDLNGLVQKFLGSQEGGVVLLDGLEYLFVQYSFTEVMRVLQSLRDAMTATGAKLLIPIDLLALVKRQRALLTREFRQL